MTLALTLRVPDDVHDALVAELADLGFDAFESEAGRLLAYAPAARWDGPAREAVARALDGLGAAPGAMTEETLPATDWNARWEASVAPIEAGTFVVAPTWTAPDAGGRHLLWVDPKMSFGTGHHPSTRLCLRLLSADGAVVPGERVLDVGTGTGVLALAALRLGAAHALGVDTDPWSVTNALENAARNGLADRVTVREGSVELVPDGAAYGLVVANILRSVLLPMLPELAARLAPGGRLILAGLLRAERAEVEHALAAVGLAVADHAGEAEWWACRAERAAEGPAAEGPAAAGSDAEGSTPAA